MKPLFTPERKKAVFLDMNRTLLDPDLAFREAFVSVLDEYAARSATGLMVPSARCYELYRKALRSSLPRARKGEAAKARLQALSISIKDAPITPGPGSLKLLLRRIDETKEANPRLASGVRETLTRLAERYHIAIISNGSKKRQESYIRRLHLANLLPPDRLFTFRKDGMRKPQPAIFERAMEGAGVEAKDAVMVGDSWKNDIMGAAGVGMDAVWINPNAAKKGMLRRVGNIHVVAVRSFAELGELFGPD